MSLDKLELAKEVFEFFQVIGWSIFDVATSSKQQLAVTLSISEEKAFEIITKAQGMVDLREQPVRRIYYEVEGEAFWTPPEPEQPPVVVSRRIQQCIESAAAQQVEDENRARMQAEIDQSRAASSMHGDFE